MKSNSSPIRLDKFLWAVRIYKTRSQASDACRNGRVIVNSSPAKPSRIVEVDDLLSIKKMPVIYTFRVLTLPSSRVGPKLVSEFVSNLTPDEELLKLDIKVGLNTGQRERGAGRPTKRERRDIDRFRTPEL